MLRILKGTRDSAVRRHTRAMTQLKALVIPAPAELRESLEHLATADLVLQFRLTETPDIPCPATAASRALQVLAARIHHLEQEIAGLGQELDRHRLRWDSCTQAYAVQRTAEGKSKLDIPRCLKRFIVSEVCRLLAANRT